MNTWLSNMLLVTVMLTDKADGNPLESKSQESAARIKRAASMKLQAVSIVLPSVACKSTPCGNRAGCVDGDENSFLCVCPPGITGKTCESHINECSSNPCQNGANCIDQANGYKCTCASGYTGGHCEIDINECSSNPCQNGGNCIDHVNEYTCTNCAYGYTGGNCEININECSSNPCMNGGICSDQVNGFLCTCVWNAGTYVGTFCQSRRGGVSPVSGTLGAVACETGEYMTITSAEFEHSSPLCHVPVADVSSSYYQDILQGCNNRQTCTAVPISYIGTIQSMCSQQLEINRINIDLICTPNGVPT